MACKGWIRVSATVDRKPTSGIREWKRIQCLVWDAHSCLCWDQKTWGDGKTGNQCGTCIVYEESSFPNRETSKAQSKCLGSQETMISSATLTTECTQKTPNEDSSGNLRFSSAAALMWLIRLLISHILSADYNTVLYICYLHSALWCGWINRNTMEATGNKTKIIKHVYH